MNKENPPRNESEVEEYKSGSELDPYATKKQQLEEIFEQASELPPTGELFKEKQEKIDQLKRSITIEQSLRDPDHLINKALTSKNDGTESFVDERLPEEKQSAEENLPVEKKTRSIKDFAIKLMAGLGLIAAGSSASATEKNPHDSTKQNKTEINFNSARKVKEIGSDYTQVVKDNKKYGYKISDATEHELPIASAKGGSVETDAYKNKIITYLQSGISPKQLAEKGYISPKRITEFEKFYVAPKVDVVYMESESQKVEDPFAAYSEDGEAHYAPNGHIAAEVRFATRKSQSITDGGMLNTQNPPVLIQFRDDFNPAIGKPFLLPAEEMQNYFTAGTTHFKSEAAYEELKARALNKSNIGTISTKDLAKE